ncbi:hypothetical protein B0H67DRAFT_680003 [Lasiosphaeris hirsuta]|uniref:Uncharacterized protein n=1 Tax=Lasiosphaeris hirsuta TaxID=260670 RepID=A0AA40AYI8_9PEZI|nr:hypothetical protein B0H67DRAFT_680003 [Lasiosphaeris hirsuta]
MASKRMLPTVKEPPTTTFQTRWQPTSSALVPTNNETQLQQYAPPSNTPIVTLNNASTSAQKPPGHNFLDWVTFTETTLPPRPNLKKSRRSKIFAPLGKLKLGLPGEVEVEGLDGLVEVAHNIFRSDIHMDFLDSERELLLPAGGTELSRKEMERLEVELFSVAKYAADSDSNYLTAMAWAEDGDYGAITLYEVLDKGGNAVGIRPVAAMREVPKQILVDMRKHEKIKKVVFVDGDADEDVTIFKWKANPSQGPTYAKLGAGDEDEGEGRYGGRLADADGIHATIPQFVALLHANRAILEEVKSTHVIPLETEAGVVPHVKMHQPPRDNAHKGDNIHVAVLIPGDASWADEQIYWTDGNGLVEFRRKRYWGLIERERRRERGSRSRSRHGSHSGEGRQRSRSRSRSRSRHDERSRSRTKRFGLAGLAVLPIPKVKGIAAAVSKHAKDRLIQLDQDTFQDTLIYYGTTTAHINAICSADRGKPYPGRITFFGNDSGLLFFRIPLPVHETTHLFLFNNMILDSVFQMRLKGQVRSLGSSDYGMGTKKKQGDSGIRPNPPRNASNDFPPWSSKLQNPFRYFTWTRIGGSTTRSANLEAMSKLSSSSRWNVEQSSSW